METEIHTQGTENGKAEREMGRQTGGKMKVQEGGEEIVKTEGDGFTDTHGREGGDLGRIVERQKG